MTAKNLPVPTWLVAASRIRSIDQVRQLTAFFNSDCWLEFNHFLAQLWRGVIRDDHKFSKICNCFSCRAYRENLSDDRRNCTCDSCQQSRDIITLMTSIVLRLVPTQLFSSTETTSEQNKAQDTTQPTKDAQETISTSEKSVKIDTETPNETQTLLETDYQAMAWNMLNASRDPNDDFCRELRSKQMRFIGHFANSLKALIKADADKLSSIDIAWLKHLGQIRLIAGLIAQIWPFAEAAPADMPTKQAALQRLSIINVALGRACEATFGQTDIQDCLDYECEH